MRDVSPHFLEHVAHGEEVLESMVVQRVGERLALALLGLERVGEQLRPHLREVLDELRPPGEHQREEDAGDADPGEEPGLGRR